MIQDFYAFPSYNAVLAAVDYARPASGSIVEAQFPADAATEIVNDTEWLMAMDSGQ